MDTATALRMAASRFADRPAIVEEDRRLSYAQLVDEMDAVAVGLATAGVRAGDRVVLAVANSLDATVVLLAVQAAGAVAVPTNFRARTAPLAHVLATTKATALVVGPHSAAAADSLTEPLPDLIVTVDGASSALAGVRPLTALRVSVGGTLTEVDDQAPAIELLTSGSTGSPKLVSLTHRQSLARVYGLFMNHGFRHDDGMRALGLMPIYHTVGLHSVLLLPLLTGGSYHPVSDFVPADVLKTVEEQAITYIFGAPTMFARLLEVEGAASRWASVQDAMYAGAPMEPALVRRVAGEITPNLTHIYGNTETYNSLYHRNAGMHPGALVPGVFHRVRIAPIGGDPEAELPVGSEGELLIDMASDEAFDGYPDSAANAARLVGGWYRTGDVAVRDEEGRIFIRGRTDDLIISGGENIYPAEVESVLAEHPGVAECAVVGVPDQTWGQLVAALVVRADPELTEPELAEFCRTAEGLDSFKRPRLLLFVDTLPVTASGKRPASELRALAAQLTDRVGTT